MLRPCFVLESVGNGHLPQKLKYTPVLDEVEAEADDESSEVDEDEDASLPLTGNTETVPKSPVPPESVQALCNLPGSFSFA